MPNANAATKMTKEIWEMTLAEYEDSVKGKKVDSERIRQGMAHSRSGVVQFDHDLEVEHAVQGPNWYRVPPAVIEDLFKRRPNKRDDFRRMYGYLNWEDAYKQMAKHLQFVLDEVNAVLFWDKTHV
jgi:hypothetical protein